MTVVVKHKVCQKLRKQHKMAVIHFPLWLTEKFKQMKNYLNL